MRLSEKLEEVLGLADKATPGEFRAVPVDGLHGYEACLLIERSAVGYVPKDSERQSGIQFYMRDAAAISAAINLLRDHGAELRQALRDSERLAFIERSFSGMTNRERYLPVRMIWGKGCNGRTLREACDKYMQREDAAMGQRGSEEGAPTTPEDAD